MKLRQTLIFFLLLLLPAGAVVLLSVKALRESKNALNHETEQHMLAQLKQLDLQISKNLDSYKAAMAEKLNRLSVNPSLIRSFIRHEPWIRNILVLSQDRRLLFPASIEPMSQTETEFVQHLRPLLADFGILPSELKNRAGTTGWQAGFWENGLSLFMWRYDDNGNLWIAEIEKTLLLADLAAQFSLQPLPFFATVVDEAGQTVLQMGLRPSRNIDGPTLALSFPFSAWKLKTLQSLDSTILITQNHAQRNLILSIVALGFVVLLLAFYFYREQTRTYREALQRVSFVNQVSHELKTPLTNISLYAEILEQELDDNQREARDHLGIILSESQRLGRLIKNVLSFSRKKPHEAFSAAPGNLNQLLKEVVEDFTPAFKRHEISPKLSVQLPQVLNFNADVVEQILVNLLSNVEKYAVAGKYLEITVWQELEFTFIRVVDQGPGIPENFHKKVFEPFYRLSNRLNEGISGTGIGLTISRRLARVHGGDLTIETVTKGASFLVKLKTV